jgi:hypothetical protein
MMTTERHPRIEWRTHAREFTGGHVSPVGNYVIEESTFDGTCQERTVVVATDHRNGYLHPTFEVLVRTFLTAEPGDVWTPWDVYLVTSNDGWVCLDAPGQLAGLQAALLEAETLARKLNEAKA